MLHKVNNSGVQIRKPEEITICTTLTADVRKLTWYYEIIRIRVHCISLSEKMESTYLHMIMIIYFLEICRYIVYPFLMTFVILQYAPKNNNDPTEDSEHILQSNNTESVRIILTRGLKIVQWMGISMEITVLMV